MRGVGWRRLEDEHDDIAPASVVRAGADEFVVDARTSLDDVATVVVRSVAGHVDHLPRRGDPRLAQQLGREVDGAGDGGVE